MSLKLICGSLIPKFQALNLKNVVLPATNIHTTAIASGKINRMRDRTSMLRTVVKKGDGTVGEKSVDLDNLIQRFVTHTRKNCFIYLMVFNNVLFNHLQPTISTISR